MFGSLISMMVGLQIIKEVKDNLSKMIGKENKDISKGTIDKGMEIAGYGYDSAQDIFYSNMNAWQRNMGYSRLYDEGSAPFGIIVDCEPIYFKYGGKRWLIEFWKGQYDLNTGCEIGVYTAEEPDSNIPEMYKYIFYNCASNEEKLPISFCLNKNGKKLFARSDKHWWLAAFKLGEFSNPSELSMDLNITLKDQIMCKAFVQGLKNAGYSDGEIIINGNNVGLTFDKPYTEQPITRTTETDRIIQMKNKILCDKYNDITKAYNNLIDKIEKVKKQAPEMYEEITDKARIRSNLRSIKNPENI